MSNSVRKTPYYEQVATKLIAQLEAGTAPWQKPRVPGEIRLPHNPVSGTRYKGSNAMWLEMQQRRGYISRSQRRESVRVSDTLTIPLFVGAVELGWCFVESPLRSQGGRSLNEFVGRRRVPVA